MSLVHNRRQLPGGRLSVLTALGLLLVSIPDRSDAQSFDCTKARTSIEKQICDDPNLGLMDEEVGSIYGELKRSLTTQAFSKLKASQRAWITQRDSCDTQSDCLSMAYAERLGQLSKDYSVFPGWSGDFTNWADIQLSITKVETGGYKISLIGAGQNWDCSGKFTATQNTGGQGLSAGDATDIIKIQSAGSGLWVPAAFDAYAKGKGDCGAAAPGLSGFFRRVADQDHAVPGFQGAPFIHPQIIRDFATWLSDTGDQVVAINLTDSQDSNRYFGDFKVEHDDKSSAPIISMTVEDQRFSYQFIGVMENGISVLKTVQSSTDGSGVFPTLMFLSFQQDHGIKVNAAKSRIGVGEDRRLIVKHGEIVSGVDWSGVLKVDGNRVFIGTNQSANSEIPTQPSGWLTYEAPVELD